MSYGILPDLAHGGAVVRNAGGVDVTPPNVHNAYVPDGDFGSDRPLTALPELCTARFDPDQMNAIVSELIGLAEAMSPTGGWDSESLQNLATAYLDAQSAALQADQNLADVPDKAEARENLGLKIGTNVQAYSANLATWAGIAPAADMVSWLDSANYAAMRSGMSLAIGTDVQAYSANLATWSGIAPASDVQTFLNCASNAAMRTALGIDSLMQGLKPKTQVRAATTVALAANTYVSGVITANANGALGAIDTVTPVNGDRLLVKNEGTASKNGIYTVTDVGDGSSPFVLTRTSDMDIWDEVPGAFCFVEEGAVNADMGWIATAVSGGTLGVTSIAWSIFAVINTVASFNGRTGAVVPANDDYAATQLAAIAANSILGNNTGAAARPIVLTVAQVKTLLALAVADVSGAAALAGNQNLTGGFTTTEYDLGTVTGGATTPTPLNGQMQKVTNNGAFTLAPPSAVGSYTLVVDITNGASAGAITTSGFTKVTGDALTTTNGHKFRAYISKGTAGSHLAIQAMQ